MDEFYAPLMRAFEDPEAYFVRIIRLIYVMNYNWLDLNILTCPLAWTAALHICENGSCFKSMPEMRASVTCSVLCAVLWLVNTRSRNSYLNTPKDAAFVVNFPTIYTPWGLNDQKDTAYENSWMMVGQVLHVRCLLERFFLDSCKMVGPKNGLIFSTKQMKERS